MSPDLEDKDSAKLSQGRALVSMWTDLLRALRIADARSELVQSWAERISALLAEACEGSDGASFSVHADSIFFNGIHLPEFGARATTYRAFARLMRTARVSSFHTTADVDLSEMVGFAERLLSAAEGRSAPEEIAAGEESGDRPGVRVIIGTPEDESALQVPGRDLQRRAYLGAIGSVKSVYHELRTSNRINTKRLKRAVQELIDSHEHNADYALRLTSVKSYDEYTFNHSVNVAVLAIALGGRLGLSRARLRELGLAAMLYDLGKLEVPPQVLNKLGTLTPEERKLFHDHPVEGLFSIASHLGVSSETVGIALAAYEHHLNIDRTGYPAQATSRPPCLLSRVIAIADRYDAMTSPRIYRAKPISPCQALSIMYHSQRSQVDRNLLAYFMSMLGQYPVGSAVRLSDNSIGVVTATHAEEDLRCFPTVKLVLDERGEKVTGDSIDLAAAAKSLEALRVIETLNAADFGIEPMSYLL